MILVFIDPITDFHPIWPMMLIIKKHPRFQHNRSHKKEIVDLKQEVPDLRSGGIPPI